MKNGIYSATTRHPTAMMPTVPLGTKALNNTTNRPSAMPVPPGVGAKYKIRFNKIMRSKISIIGISGVKAYIKVGAIQYKHNKLKPDSIKTIKDWTGCL